jgi:hypothetical protein
MNYRIKPLEWEYEEYDNTGFDEREKEWMAFTRFGHFEITKAVGIDDLLICRDFGGSDYHYYRKDSVEEAKELCEKLWVETLEECLIKEN